MNMKDMDETNKRERITERGKYFYWYLLCLVTEG